LIDLKGTVALLPAPEQSYIEPRMSPDEKKVAASIQSGKDFNILVYDISLNTTSRLTFGGINRSPVWSPDSRRIAYSDNTPASGANTGGTSKVVMIQADGRGSPIEVVLNCDRNYVNCWSRDGSTLVVTVPKAGKGWDLYTIPVNGDHKSQVFLSTMFDESVGALSPDGRWIAYLSNETGGAGIYVRPFPHGEGKWQIATDLPSVPAWPNWSADGKTLYFMSTAGIMALSIGGTTSLIHGQPRLFLKGFHGEAVESGVSYGITRDNQHILATVRNNGGDERQQINVVLNWVDELRATVTSRK
jgi:Tol biopolymer transport system component